MRGSAVLAMVLAALSTLTALATAADAAAVGDVSRAGSAAADHDRAGSSAPDSRDAGSHSDADRERARGSAMVLARFDVLPPSAPTLPIPPLRLPDAPLPPSDPPHVFIIRDNASEAPAPNEPPFVAIVRDDAAHPEYEEALEPDPYAETYGPGRKLKRGLTNMFTGVVEIPWKIWITGNERNWLAGWMLGLANGVGWAGARILAGVYDTLTFPIPAPFRYEPVLEPEYLWMHNGVNLFDLLDLSRGL